MVNQTDLQHHDRPKASHFQDLRQLGPCCDLARALATGALPFAPLPLPLPFGCAGASVSASTQLESSESNPLLRRRRSNGPSHWGDGPRRRRRRDRASGGLLDRHPLRSLTLGMAPLATCAERTAARTTICQGRDRCAPMTSNMEFIQQSQVWSSFNNHGPVKFDVFLSCQERMTGKQKTCIWESTRRCGVCHLHRSRL